MVAFSADGQDRLSTEHTLTAQGKPSTQQDFPRAPRKRQCGADERASARLRRAERKAERRADRAARCAARLRERSETLNLFYLFYVPFLGLCYNLLEVIL